jgi:hypothetical protein
LRTTRLCTVNPLVVGFTHATGAIAGVSAAQSAGAAPAGAAALARKNVPLLTWSLQLPFARVRALPRRRSALDFGPPRTTTITPARG